MFTGAAIRRRCAFLLKVLPERRINEILLIDPEPLIALPGIDASAEPDPEAFLARLRYCQSKISGAPDTILVEREIVNIVCEQQRWLQAHLAAINPALAAGQAAVSARLPGSPTATATSPIALTRCGGCCASSPANFRSTPGTDGWSTFSALTGCATPERPGCSTAACDPCCAALSRASVARDDDALRRDPAKTHEREFLRFKSSAQTAVSSH